MKKELTDDRKRVLAKIAEFEEKGGESFFCDVEADPPSRTLMPRDVDYLHASAKYKINGFFARITENMCRCVCKHKFRIKVEGKENLRNISGGAVFTSNHFSVNENLAVNLAAKSAPGKHRFYKLIREGNYFMPGIIGWLLKYCDTLPLSESFATTRLLDRAISEILKRGDFILVYPEQAMWWYYKKPRPYRIGAFYYAAKNGVPVVPCFVTMAKKNEKFDMLPDNVRLTVHILEPIFPENGLGFKENAERMRERNAFLTRECFEKVYGESAKI